MKKTPPHRPFLRLVGSEPDDQSYSGVWQDGDSFIISHDAPLPDRCLKCGEPTDGWTRKKTLYWHSPLWFGLLPVFVGLVYVIVASVVKKSIVLHIPLCDQHRGRYLWGTRLALILIPAFPVLLIAGILEAQPPLLITGIFCSLAGIAAMIWARNPIWATHINEETARVRGAHRSWLERLPPWRRAS
jgi:hypothetical protein